MSGSFFPAEDDLASNMGTVARTAFAVVGMFVFVATFLSASRLEESLPASVVVTVSPGFRTRVETPQVDGWRAKHSQVALHELPVARPVGVSVRLGAGAGADAGAGAV